MPKKSAKAARKKGAKRARAAEKSKRDEKARAKASTSPTDRIAAVRQAMAAGEAPAPRGLTNLGNTCFFNSVMQNIARIAPLRNYFVGGDPEPNEGAMTSALRAYMLAQWDVKANTTYNPSQLFTEIGKKNARFKGRAQQDSHEVWRVLLDCVIEEEKKRLAAAYRASQSSTVSSSETTSSTEDEEGNTSSKEPRVPPNELITILEKYIGGRLSSTVTCTECGTKSSVYEPFLDIPVSLVPKEAPEESAPEPASAVKKSKGGKNAKQNGADAKTEESSPNVPVAPPPPPPPPPPPLPPPPAPASPVTSNISFGEAIANQVSKMNISKDSEAESAQPIGENTVIYAGPPPADPDYFRDDDGDEELVFPLFDDDDDDVFDAANKENDAEKEDETAVSTAVSPVPAKKAPPPPSRGFISSCLGLFGGTTPAPHGYESIVGCLEEFTKVEVLEKDNAYGCEECTRREKLRIALRRRETKGAKKLVKPSVDIVSTSSAAERSPSSVHGTVDSEVGDTLEALNKEDRNPEATLPDCSKQSSNESEIIVTSSPVTSSESSTGGNSEEEDSDSASKDSGEGGPAGKALSREEENALIESLNLKIPTVQTKAKKQLMIETAPEILVLQLKRFSQVGFRGGLRKISGHVDFPLELDLAKFVDKRSPGATDTKEDRNNSSGRSSSRKLSGKRAHRNSSKNAKGKNNESDYKYVLTGVSVHGGSIAGGHYVAYVREGVDADCRGDWFLCSDSRVSRSSEDSVLKSEAYLLFYEKV